MPHCPPSDRDAPAGPFRSALEVIETGLLPSRGITEVGIAGYPEGHPRITAEAKTWIADLACRKAKQLGYPHELWTTRLLARHAREHGPTEGHTCLAAADHQARPADHRPTPAQRSAEPRNGS